MEILQTVFTAVGSMIVLFLLTKIMGNRQMSDLSMFDYINSITIGSITAEMATSLEDITKPLVAMIVYGLLSVIIAFLTCKSIVLRRFFEGHNIVLYQEGKIHKKNLMKSRIDVDEFLSMCREKDYFDLQDIHTIILETNGKVSIIPIAKKRPTTTEDLNLDPAQDFPFVNVIIDGHILIKNLKTTGKDEEWLYNQLNAQGVTDKKEVLLATYQKNNDRFNVYKKFNQNMSEDIFQ